MQRLLVRLLLVAPLLCASLAQAQSREEQAIRSLIDRAVQAASSVDEKVAKQTLGDYSSGAGPFYSPFAPSIGSVGELDALISKSLAQFSARSVSITGPVTVRVDRNLAWAAFPWRAELTFKDGSRHSFEGRTTGTFVRERRDWKWAHWHDSIPAQMPLTGAALQAEADAVLKVEQDAWEAEKNKQLDALADYFAEDASMFGEGQAYRLRGKADVMQAVESWVNQTDLRSYQMLDPQVQVVGNTALLTYYFTFAGVSGGKEISQSGKITMVFVKQDGKWRALHAHVSATP